ncbi:hypothetical protein ACOI1C_10445 [Bacillus sp. DJP31]|uniref:hypothetical protein n=1 Tax=Bacillus sp. DJP31 TaxID=3409789 RepID=UPI003BB65E52
MANKHNKYLGPRRKRWGQQVRLLNAKVWVKENQGKNVIRRYAKWYGVDLLCALNELQILGLTFSAEEKQKVNQALVMKQLHNQRMKEKRESQKELMWEDDDLPY